MKKPEKYFSCNRSEMVKFVPQKSKIVLDVGCGAGDFGLFLKTTRNIEIWGFELCENVANMASKKLDRVIIGNIENEINYLPLKYFDCIVFNDILEHLVSPWDVLKKIKYNLKDDGYIVASIPNVRFFNNIISLLIKREWKYEESGVLDKTHLRFFSANTIIELFKSTGYKLLNIEGIHGIEFPIPFRLLNRLLLRMFEDMRYLDFACVAKKM